MVEEIEGSQSKWHKHLERMPLNIHNGKHIFITLLQDGGIGHSRKRSARFL
jgi:hypothetical protein